MKFLILSLSIFLTACATTGYKDVQVLTKTEYVVRTATAQQKQIPPYPPNINVQTADQVQLANWIAETEERQLRLENIIQGLINFYEAPVVEVK